MSIKRRLGRALVALGVSGAILAGPLGVGQAHSAVESFSGMGTGFALRVTLDLRPLIGQVPAVGTVLNTVVGAIPGATMDTPGVIDQYFIRTTSDANGSVTKARSSLAEGLINLDVVEATQVGQIVEKAVQTVQIPSASLPVLEGTIGSLRAAVVQGPDVDGAGTLNQLNVQLPLDALPDAVGDLLDGLVGDLVEALDGVLNGILGDVAGENLVGGLTEQITGLTGSLGVSQLGNLAGGLGLPVDALGDEVAVTSALEDLLDVEALLAQIEGLLNQNLLEGALASVTGLVNTTNALLAADGSNAAAESVASLAGLDVLGGLVDVSAFNLMSRSEAAGTPGSAKNTSSCSLVDVKVGGDALGISLDGTNVFIGGQPVAVVGDLVGTVKGLVDGVLATLGINVGLCDVAQSQADRDGTAAAQRVSALHVEIAPLAGQLFSLVIDPTVETAVAARVAAPAADKAPEPVLPRTGAGIVATVISGIALAGGAVLVRRRLVS